MFQHAMNRRQAIQLITVSAAALGAGGIAAEAKKDKMTINLMCGMIGVHANQIQAVELAHRHKFTSVEAMASDLARMSDEEVKQLKGSMREKNVVFGAAGLPVEFRQDDAKFEEGLKALPKLAAGLNRAEVKRVGTWLMPGHDQLTYRQNFKRHVARLKQVCEVLRDHDLKLGLEYVGTKTLRDRFRYQFVYSMAETKELIAEIGTGNAGFILDSWHWWNAGESADDILTIKGDQVVAVDLNDAPAGIPKVQQQDGRRELPMATGVIPVKMFLEALVKIGYDGPVRAEPFSKPLNDLDNDAACAKTSEAMHKAFALIRA
jgi:sugar phosphate isomerase/epimerase